MTMNVKNMRKLRAWLRSRKNPVGFGMGDWFRHGGKSLVTPTAICRAVETHSCGTVACLAGHAAILAWQSGDMPKKKGVSIKHVAVDWLGLDDNETSDLFYGRWSALPFATSIWEITKAQAIAELTRLIEAET